MTQLMGALERISRLPDIPFPFGRLDDLRYEISGANAVYFLFGYSGIEYVGSALCLFDRIGGTNLWRHHAVELNDSISWIEFDAVSEHELRCIESFYIWLCRPRRNFGGKQQLFNENQWHKRVKRKKND